MAQTPIRVVICDDSLVAREMLAQILASDPEIEVVGQAKDGREAVSVVGRLKPDLVTMDIHMPEMDGVAAVEQIMAYTPVPILVVSSSVRGPGIGYAFEALKAGALEVIKKPEPRDWEDLERIGRDIIKRVKVLARVRVITHIAGRRTAEARASHARVELPSAGGGDFALVAIGTSTGGPSALMTVLSSLRSDFPVPIVVAQHIAEGFIPGLVEWLSTGSKVRVRAAEDGAAPLPGHVYLAPTGRNLAFDGSAMRFVEPTAGQLYIPSADTLFSSVAESLRRRAIGVILTGMGNDGARGLKEMRDSGAATLAQDEKTSVVFGMPRAAVELGAASAVLPLDAIGREVQRLVDR
jgi:two-component system chemotaxis response regulator CheB